MKFYPLNVEETAYQKFTHRLDFSYLDIPAGLANNTAQVWNITNSAVGFDAGVTVFDAYFSLVTPFANSADTAFNSDTISFGDDDSATSIFSAVEANLNGTYVSDQFASALNIIYDAGDYFKLTLNSMSGKSLSNLNQGQAYILLKLFNWNRLSIIDSSQLTGVKNVVN